MELAEHPTVRRVRSRDRSEQVQQAVLKLDADWLRQLCFEAGANDVDFVQVEQAKLDDQRGDVLRYFPRTKTLVSFVCRMNREPIRSPARSVANLEFHHTGGAVNEVPCKIVAALERRGVGAINPAMGFQMEMDEFSGKVWPIFYSSVLDLL